MELKVELLKWSAGRPVVILNKKTAARLGANVNERVFLKKHLNELLAILDTASGFIKEDSIAVSLEVQEKMNLHKNEIIEVNLSPTSGSLEFIKKKMQGHTLEKNEFHYIIRDIVMNYISEAEVSFFISAIYKNGMTLKETSYLIESILENGKKLSLNKKIIADKHCIGGIAGNRTTPIVVSICAAAGLTIPKTSSRAITSAAGTADVIEAIAQVDFSIEDLKRIIAKTNAFMVWGGSLDLLPADNEILRIEKMLRIDVPSMLLASILSKKISVGSTHVLIDIPYGKSAKVNYSQAMKLKKEFEQLGEYFNLKLKCVLTNGSQPIGNGIGPILELRDVISILEGNKVPKDLEKKSIFLAGQLLELTGKAKKYEGEKIVKDILYSKKALEKFKEIIKMQNGKVSNLHLAKYKYDVKSKYKGKIIEIDNKKINELAREAGCPSDKAAGLYLYHHIDEIVNKNEIILTIYAETPSRLKKAKDFYEKINPIKIKKL